MSRLRLKPEHTSVRFPPRKSSCATGGANESAPEAAVLVGGRNCRLQRLGSTVRRCSSAHLRAMLTLKVWRCRGNFGIRESVCDCYQIATMRIQNNPKQPEPTAAKVVL